MKQVLIIPDRNNIKECLELAAKYGLGFEYNDFFMPDVLDDEKKIAKLTLEYKMQELPFYCTLHGAFFDVIPFSMDARIREIASLRIEQSIDVAKRLGAKAVVFHTNYNPFLNSESYVASWIEGNIAFWSGVLEKHADINIYLENMFDTGPDILEALSEKLCKYSNYGVCLDFAHASLSKAAPEIWAKRLGRFVKHVHINDNDGVSDLHLAWGDGVIDRQNFYECYENYMKGASVLVETSSVENILKSLEVLYREEFLECIM
ncbi:MAG: sugar phosphate isomerase/epimerase [Lachnospiraceae bacterium]|nr:sugar phosphate isomerase/epimerase [Lachnospiraceae bacterium]